MSWRSWALNADAEVMRYFPRPMDPADSDALVDRIEQGFAVHGFGMWAVEVRGGPPFIGFVGLTVPRFEAPFPPCVEVGWRLARAHWGRGYAPEAARAALAFGFEEAGLAELIYFTATTNLPSRRVMEKIGMVHDPAADFDHPNAPERAHQEALLHRDGVH